MDKLLLGDQPHLGEHDRIAQAIIEFEKWHNKNCSDQKKKMTIIYEKRKGIHYCLIKTLHSKRPVVGSDKLEHIAAKKALEIASKKTGYKKVAKVITDEKQNFVKPILKKETA